MANLQHTLIRGVGGATTGASVIMAIGNLLSLTVSPLIIAVLGLSFGIFGLLDVDETDDKSAAAE